MALYLEHFGLSEPPFRITPHTDFFFEGADRGATLEALVYAILHDEGIVKVSGEVGSGKTMLCRVLMERLPAQVDTIYLATPSLARDEIVQAIAEDLGLRLSGDRVSSALRALQEHLIARYAEGRRVVVLIDEAHVMPEETLEQVRLLSNLESNRHKLLQIVLFGQPELDATLAKRSLRQLRDRVTHSFRTRPLSEREVANYLSFRMRAAGYRGPDIFGARAARRLARAAGGLTRRINILADKALLAAYTESRHAVKSRHVGVAVRDSEFAALERRTRVLPFAVAALVAGIALGVALQWSWAPTQRSIDQSIAAPPPTPMPQPPIPTPPAAPKPAPALLNPAQLQRLGDYSAAGRPLLESRLAATAELLRQAPDERYSIELFVAENADPDRMERFLRRAADMVPLEQLYVIPMRSAGRYRLRVVLGNFATLEDAQGAERRLPPKYQRAFRATAYSFAELRRDL